ncbi:MAG: type II toxin-antitoxin system HicB family antitoxin [Verrucomicrobiota bacterium]|nr:type II toxin-antitoxin system HicB family antitoxin [Verrucomicrobiota bacterium]
MNIPHHINIFWSEEDSCFVADVPDLKHCTGQGDSPQEALEDALETRDAWIEACLSAGEQIPKPTYQANQ